MPLSHLYVEGSLDVTVVASLLSTLPGGGPAVRASGGKGSQRPRVAEERRKSTESCYLRDRDFDNDPPEDATVPTVDRVVGGVTHGWRWCRHELESYLLEPEIVAQATGWELGSSTRALLAAARSLTHYSAARWAVGTARRALPPLFEFATRPDGLTNPVKVPVDLSKTASRDWALSHVGGYRGKLEGPLNEATIVDSFERWSLRLGATRTAEEALLLNGGKDLLAALEPVLVREARGNPTTFCNASRDWIVANPSQAIRILPEWAALVRQLA